MTKSVLILLIMLLFGILARRYKLRTREEVVNIYGIVSDIYTRYLSQTDKSGIRKADVSCKVDFYELN